MKVKEKVAKILEKEEGIIKVSPMDEKTKKELTLLEMKRLEEMVPLINKGFEEAVNEENVYILVKDKTGITVPDEELISTLTLMSEDGTLIGEEIYDPEELEELKEDPNVYFISEHFVTYPHLSKPGMKQFFVVNQLRGELECEDEVEKLVSQLSIAAPSTEADHYIKDLFGMDYIDGIVTMIIGFTE